MLAAAGGSSAGIDTWLLIVVALIAAGAAIAGAVIAAVTAVKLQRRRLSHDTGRQGLALGNDRRIASLDARRRVLNGAAELLLRTETR